MKPRQWVTVRWDGLNWQAELWQAGFRNPIDMKYVTGDYPDDASGAIEDARVHFCIDEVAVAE